MKKLIALIAALNILSAFAGEVVVYNKPAENDISSYSPKFEINRSLGRAWVEIEFNTYNSDGPLYYNDRVQVKGLRFDTDSNEVVMDIDGTSIVCAKVKKQLFNSYYIRATGKCKFEQKRYVQQVDNGYEVENVSKVKITLKF